MTLNALQVALALLDGVIIGLCVSLTIFYFPLRKKFNDFQEEVHKNLDKLIDNLRKTLDTLPVREKDGSIKSPFQIQK